jgi:hypothetical protein
MEWGELLYEEPMGKPEPAEPLPSEEGTEGEIGAEARPDHATRLEAKREFIRKLAKQAIRLVGAAIVMLVIVSFSLFYLLEESSFFPMFLGMLGLFIVVLATLAIGTYRIRHHEPERYYTEGFSVSDTMGGMVFVPWSRVLLYEEYDWTKEEFPEDRLFDPNAIGASNRGIIIHGNGYTEKIISSDIKNINRIIKKIKEHAGGVGKFPTKAEGLLRMSFLRGSLLILGISAVLSFIVVALFGTLMPSLFGSGLNAIIIDSIALTILFFILFLFYMTYYMWAIPRGLHPHVVSILIVVLLVLSLHFATSSLDLSEMNYDIEVLVDDYPGSSEIEPGEYIDEVFTLTGPVAVGYGESLTFINCVLKFDLEPLDEYGIWVHEDGYINMINTTVTSVNRDYYSYDVEIHGVALIRDCFFGSVDGYSFFVQHPYVEGGLEIHNDASVIVNTTIKRPLLHGIVVVDCSPTITGCRFANTRGSGIEVIGGSPLIDDCTFEDGLRAVRFMGAKGTVRNCTFDGNEEGVTALWSDVSVFDCEFVGNEDEAIVYDSYSDVVLVGNVFEGNGKDVLHDRSWDWKSQPLAVQMAPSCISMTVVITILALVPLHVRLGHIQTTGGRPAKKFVKRIQEKFRPQYPEL